MYFNTLFGKVLKKKTRDRDGITYLEGKQRVPSLRSIGFSLILSIPAMAMAIIHLSIPLSPTSPIAALRGFPEATALQFSVYIAIKLLPVWGAFSLLTGGLWLLRMRQRLKPLSSTAEICSRFQIEESQLREKATEQGIRPRFNVNGEDLYDLADFGEAAILLRASIAPAQSEELLRPAANSETPQELLLRPAASGIASQRTRIKTDEDTQSVLYLTNRQED